MTSAWSKRKVCIFGLTIVWAACAFPQNKDQNCDSKKLPAQNAHNVILFVTDGLRHEAVTLETAPMLFSLRQQGVDFVNSHSLFPTVTTPNASALATGHQLGDTGDFGNALYVGRPVSLSKEVESLTPFIEDDKVLATINQFYAQNQPKTYIALETLLDLARREGYATAVIGKKGPAGIQNITEIQFNGNGALADTCAIVIDDQTAEQIGPQGVVKAGGVPLSQKILTAMVETGLGTVTDVRTPGRNNGQPNNSQRDNVYPGNYNSPGTLAANTGQQQFLADAVTQVVLPAFKDRPFVLIFWSRDPDGSQHNQGDSLNQLRPGINGPTSYAAIHNADNNLSQIIGYLKSHGLLERTDIIAVADHGFSTISKREIDSKGNPTTSYATQNSYGNVVKGYLPPGFVAIDLAHDLHMPLFDPDSPITTDKDGTQRYKQMDISGPGNEQAQHPLKGNGVIGGTGKIPDQHDSEKDAAEVVVAANGGADLIYLPHNSSNRQQLAEQISGFLLHRDYVDGVFVNDEFGKMPGTLSLTDIGLSGTTKLPKPAMVVNLKSFSMDDQTPQLGRLTRIEIADTDLQAGQGMHGSFSRADTFNNMIAFGPDFKEACVDRAPVSNADIEVTLACVLKWKSCSEPPDSLRGRVLREALKTNPSSIEFKSDVRTSEGLVTDKGTIKTVLYRQQVFDGGHEYVYYDQACEVTGEPVVCK